MPPASEYVLPDDGTVPSSPPTPRELGAILLAIGPSAGGSRPFAFEDAMDQTFYAFDVADTDLATLQLSAATKKTLNFEAYPLEVDQHFEGTQFLTFGSRNAYNAFWFDESVGATRADGFTLPQPVDAASGSPPMGSAITLAGAPTADAGALDLAWAQYDAPAYVILYGSLACAP